RMCAHHLGRAGTYTTAVLATDKAGVVVRPPVVETLTVKDVAPTLGPITVNPAQVQENGKIVTVSGSYTDPGQLDTHTVTIDWGDGTKMTSTDPNSTIVIDAKNRSFTATHLYLDNPPAGPNASYTVTAFVTDNSGLSSNISKTTVEVDNVAPIFAGVTLNGVPAAPPANGQITSTITILEKGVVNIVGSFRDPGILDTEKLSIDWDDPGTPPQLVTVTRDAKDPELWHFTASHQYIRDNPGGVYMPVRLIEMTATDKDGGTTTTSAKIT